MLCLLKRIKFNCNMQKNLLITGAAGFIGSNLIDSLLEKGYYVVCLDNFDKSYPRNIKEKNIEYGKNFTFIEGDICNSNLIDTIFEKYSIDLVIHLAAKAGVRPSILNPIDYFNINVIGTLTLLEVMKKYKVKKLINASSSSVYGNNNTIPFSEDDNVNCPISPYAASKRSAELLTYNYHYLFNFDIINLRFFTVYGPRQRPDLAIHKFFQNLYLDKPIEIFGNGRTSRDYTYIDDIVSGINSSINVLLNNSNLYEIINLGNSNPIELNELILLIEKITSKKFRIVKKENQPGDVNLTYANINKAHKILDYDPKVNINDGLIYFNKWFLDQII